MRAWRCMRLLFFLFFSFLLLQVLAHVVHCGINSCGLQSFTVQMANKKTPKKKKKSNSEMEKLKQDSEGLGGGEGVRG